MRRIVAVLAMLGIALIAGAGVPDVVNCDRHPTHPDCTTTTTRRTTTTVRVAGVPDEVDCDRHPTHPDCTSTTTTTSTSTTTTVPTTTTTTAPTTTTTAPTTTTTSPTTTSTLPTPSGEVTDVELLLSDAITGEPISCGGSATASVVRADVVIDTEAIPSEHWHLRLFVDSTLQSRVSNWDTLIPHSNTGNAMSPPYVATMVQKLGTVDADWTVRAVETGEVTGRFQPDPECSFDNDPPATQADLPDITMDPAPASSAEPSAPVVSLHHQLFKYPDASTAIACGETADFNNARWQQFVNTQASPSEHFTALMEMVSSHDAGNWALAWQHQNTSPGGNAQLEIQTQQVLGTAPGEWELRFGLVGEVSGISLSMVCPFTAD